LLDFVKGPLDFFRWSELMNGVVESIDGFIAVSKALWDIHVHHLSGLGSKQFSIVVMGLLYLLQLPLVVFLLSRRFGGFDESR